MALSYPVNSKYDMNGLKAKPVYIIESEAFTQALENNANGQAIYVGEALPGTLKSATGWRIKKITYDVNNYITDIQWADGTSEFAKVWDDRATYTYS